MDPREKEKQTGTELNPYRQPEEEPGGFAGFFRGLAANWKLKGILILVLLLAAMYGWRNLSVRRIEKETKQQAAQITEATGERLLEKNRALLRMTSIPLSWVVRMEMPKGNYDNIDQYFKQIIKEDNFKVILLAGVDGKIIVSTDRRMEGANFSEYYPADLLEQYETTVRELNEQDLIVVTPVIGLTAKLGTLVMVYPMREAEAPAKSSPEPGL